MYIYICIKLQVEQGTGKRILKFENVCLSNAAYFSHLRNTRVESLPPSQYGGSFDSKRSSKLKEELKIFRRFKEIDGQLIFFFRYCIEIKEGGKKRKGNLVYEIREGRVVVLYRCFSTVVPANGKTSGIPLVDGKIVDSRCNLCTKEQQRAEERRKRWKSFGKKSTLPGSVPRQAPFRWRVENFLFSGSAMAGHGFFPPPRALGVAQPRRVNAKIYLRCYLWRKRAEVHIQS